MREWNSTQSTRSKEAEKLLYFHVAGKVMTAPWFYGSNRSVNRVTKIEYPGALVGDEGFGYDDAGGLLWKKDGNGKFTLYQYDDLHRLIAVYYLPGALPNPISYEGLTAGVTYTYNGGISQRETMTDAAGTSAFEYDAQGRLSQYTPPLGLDTGYYVEYAYNNAGQKTGVKIWNGTTASYDVSYEYYANGWLKAVKYGGATVASYAYDAVGNRTRVDYGNGTYTTFGYESGDPRYRLETITHKLGTTTLATFGYTRDDVGNPLSFTGIEGAWAYSYDAMNRLASATPPGVPLPAQAGGTYSYDWVGNMKAAAASNPWQYNAADQLTVWPGMHSYSYDANGALTAVKTADGQTEQETFTYDATGLMNTATFNNQTQTLTDLWDADEHRVKFSIGENNYTAVFDVTAGIPAVIKEVTPQGTVYYVREPGGELICRVVETTKRYYHFDELGSTRAITDDSGSVTDRYSYDAYGAVISHERNMGTIAQPYQYVGQLGYYTHYQASEFGWLQLGERFYEPEIGRFERRDPILGNSVAYAYCKSSPLMRTDPWGLAPRFVGCNKEQQDRVRRHIDDLLRNRMECTTVALGPAGAECVRRRLTQNAVFECEDATDANCSTGDYGYVPFPTPRNSVHLCPNMFSDANSCLGKTLLHELAHSCTAHQGPPPPGQFPGNDWPEGWQCERECYSPQEAPCPN